MMLGIRALPNHVRPTIFETAKSYAERLGVANHFDKRAWGRTLPALGRGHEGETVASMETVVEALGGLQDGYFAAGRANLPTHSDGTQCARCSTGLAGRFACTRCTEGAVAAEEDHDGPRVCRKHMRWIGPGIQPEEQRSVGPEVLRADRAYRRLRRHGLVDAHRLAETMTCVNWWADAEASPSPGPETRFVVAMTVIRAVLSPRRISIYSDSNREEADRYEDLSRAVESIVGGSDCVVLVDALWMLLRTVGFAAESTAHAFVCPKVTENRDCANYFAQMRSCPYPREMYLHLAQFVGSEEAGHRVTRARKDARENQYVCFQAHLFRTARYSLRNSKDGGCAYCSRTRPYPGFNTLADTNPELAAEWDYEANVPLRPDSVLSGSPTPVKWRCRESHPFIRSPAARTGKKRLGCYYCSGAKFDSRYNSLSVTHPAVASGWHPTMNGSRTPDAVSPNSRDGAIWICPKGHAFPMRISRRVAGKNCQYCSRKKSHPTTSLAITHPDLVPRWHRRRNGRITPFDVLSGSVFEAWWQCPKSNLHSYPQLVSRAAAGDGCPYCSNQRVCADNCMRFTHPHLASEFIEEKNAPLTPDNVCAGTSHKLWWRCAFGHEWPATGDSRVAGRGCRVCANREVACGFNDIATTHPEWLAEWDYAKNGDLLPTMVVAGTHHCLYFKCENGHEWDEIGLAHLQRKHGCTECRWNRSAKRMKARARLG